MEVGVRELKAKLSEYLAKAAAGKTVTVTDRGKPIAKLSSIDEVSSVSRGIEEGWIEPAKARSLATVKRHNSSKSAMQVLAEDRQ